MKLIQSNVGTFKINFKSTFSHQLLTPKSQDFEICKFSLPQGVQYRFADFYLHSVATH